MDKYFYLCAVEVFVKICDKLENNNTKITIHRDEYSTYPYHTNHYIKITNIEAKEETILYLDNECRLHYKNEKDYVTLD